MKLQLRASALRFDARLAAAMRLIVCARGIWGHSMSERFPIVTYELEQNGSVATGVGYLIHTPDGNVWCFPSNETIEKYPAQKAAFAIASSQLREQYDSGNGRKIFTYQGGRKHP
jgi:hypothetical protein